MLMFKERRPAIRTFRGWAIAVMQQAGAIRECEEHIFIRERERQLPRARNLHRQNWCQPRLHQSLLPALHL